MKMICNYACLTENMTVGKEYDVEEFKSSDEFSEHYFLFTGDSNVKCVSLKKFFDPIADDDPIIKFSDGKRYRRSELMGSDDSILPPEKILLQHDLNLPTDINHRVISAMWFFVSQFNHKKDFGQDNYTISDIVDFIEKKLVQIYDRHMEDFNRVINQRNEIEAELQKYKGGPNMFNVKDKY